MANFVDTSVVIATGHFVLTSPKNCSPKGQSKISIVWWLSRRFVLIGDVDSVWIRQEDGATDSARRISISVSGVGECGDEWCLRRTNNGSIALTFGAAEMSDQRQRIPRISCGGL